MLEFIDNDDTKMVTNFMSTDEMIERFDQLGLIDGEISENYGENVTDMCNIATAYVGQFLIQHYGVSLKVCEGVYDMMGNHTWLLLPDEMIIDATLAQFVPTAPDLAFVAPDSREYQAVRTYWFDEWTEQLDD